MKNYLVTGASGFIGQGIVDRLLKSGQNVTALVRGANISQRENLDIIGGDIFSAESSVFDGVDVLIHLAWHNGFDHWDPSHLKSLPLHYEFIKKALDAGVGQIVVMGSMHEVGYHEGAVFEDTPCNPTTPYGVAKNALRQLTLELCRQKGVLAQWLRGYYIVDTDGRNASVFSKLLDADREGRSTFPFTSGKNAYDFLEYDEFCDQVVAVVEQDEVGGIINICSGIPIALGDRLEAYIAENGLSISLAYGEFPDRPYDSPAIWGDNDAINRILAARC